MSSPMRASFAHYEMFSQIGAGGMGEVFLARDTRLERKVAIKFLSEEFASHSDRLARFVQEAKTASALNHPNIITVYEIGEIDGASFMAVEYVDGQTLRQRMSAGKISFDEVLSIGIQTAEALSAAHQAGIIHRDIKPENIMVRPDGYVKVLDFGLAKLNDPSDQQPVTPEEATVKLIKTNPGVVMGTASYMSPEQARSKEVDARSDIFSFGTVMYEILAGRLPFTGETMMDVISAVMNTEPVPLESAAPHLPAELRRIVHKSLKKKPEQRYQSTNDLLNDLKELRDKLHLESKLERTAAPNKALTTEVRFTTHSGGVKDALLLTEFDNTTGEAIFDQTLKTALAFSLAQSPFLDIIPDSKVSQTLRLMGRSPVERVTKELGEEICLRQNLKAFLTASISNFGSIYVITLEAINARTGESLGRELEQVNSREEILSALGKAAAGMREKLGESLSSIEKFSRPLDHTTSSLVALKLFSLAREQQFKGKQLEAIPFYKKALEIDPKFAQAYVSAAATYGNTNQWRLASEMMQKAYELRETVSENEKLRITYFYHIYITGELDRAVEELELWKNTFPFDYIPHVGLSDIYERIGQSEKAVNVAREGLRLDPDYATSYVNLAEPLISLGRLSEARDTCRDAFERGCDSYFFHQFLYQIAFIESDEPFMGEQLKWFSGRNDEYLALDLSTGAAAFSGKWRASQDLSRRAVDLANRSDAKEIAAQYAAEQALRIVFWSGGSGLPQSDSAQLRTVLKTQTNRALNLERGKEVMSRTALVMAAAGQPEYATWLADELHTERPRDTLLNELWLPLIRAATSLQSGKAREAISELAFARRCEKAGEFIPQYLRGLAFLSLSRWDEAAAEFGLILDNRGQAPLSSLYPLAQLGKARALKDKNEYEKFFELWKDADTDMPPLLAARRETAVLFPGDK